eukprot:TRINITY_DN4996_c0_g1_i7.p1 TRINITY_DN4996_c0_g1~~TRINITY_DN4996_c0_g1_i7.p1  ORF type:complete len:183 (-),score=41.98 TRINITY_DN4996_c0_g1_i7:76-624(-)
MQTTGTLERIRAMTSMLKTKNIQGVSLLSRVQEHVDGNEIPASGPIVNVMVDSETDQDISGSATADQMHAARLATKVSRLGIETAGALTQINAIVSTLNSKKGSAATFFGKSQQGVHAVSASLPTVNVIGDVTTDFEISGSNVADQLHAARVATKMSNLRSETAETLKQIQATLALLQARKA